MRPRRQTGRSSRLQQLSFAVSIVAFVDKAALEKELRLWIIVGKQFHNRIVEKYEIKISELFHSERKPAQGDSRCLDFLWEIEKP